MEPINFDRKSGALERDLNVQKKVQQGVNFCSKIISRKNSFWFQTNFQKGHQKLGIVLEKI